MMNQKEVWNNIAKEWDEYRKKPFDNIMPYLEKTGGKVLDMGCGSGRNFVGGDEIVGTDFSKEMLKLAAKKNMTTGLAVADNFSIPFKDDVFDAVRCLSVIHCMKEGREEALEEAFRVLKKGGSLLLNVWDKNQPGFRGFGKEIIRKWGENERYYYLFDIDELNRLVEKVGFRIVESRSFIDGLNPVTKKPKKNILILAEKPE